MRDVEDWLMVSTTKLNSALGTFNSLWEGIQASYKINQKQANPSQRRPIAMSE